MSLTKKQAIAEHRKMWNWLADETEKRERCVDKWEYFYEKGISEEKIPNQNCFCCEYADFCMFCPVQWNTTGCASGEYGQWCNALINDDYKRAAKIARKIANLPVA